MKIRRFEINGILLIEPKRVHDLRGYFCETYNAAELAKHGLDVNFIQDNLLFSTTSGAVSGLHFQCPPFEQGRLIRVVRGAIFQVALDIRAGSPTFGKHVGVELSGENGLQLYVPPGFAHGFATLRPLTEISCKVSGPHSTEHERGIFWNDPFLRISWPFSGDEAVLAARDEALPSFRELESPFQYQQHTESGVAA